MQRSQDVAAGPVPTWSHAPSNASARGKREALAKDNERSLKAAHGRKPHGGAPKPAVAGSARFNNGAAGSASNAKSQTLEDPARKLRANSSSGGGNAHGVGGHAQPHQHHAGKGKQGNQADAASTAVKAQNLDPALVRKLQHMVRKGGAVLDLCGQDLGPEHMHVIAEALKGNRTLNKLILCRNPIGDQGCELLADALRFNAGLTEIDLSDTNSSGNGVRALCKKLKESKWLKARVRKLNLAGNRHGVRGPTAIYRTLSFASSLRDLTLDRMNYEGADRLATALASNQTPLVRLVLLQCDLDDAFAASLARIITEHESLRALTVGDFSRPEASSAESPPGRLAVPDSAVDAFLLPLSTGAARLEELALVGVVVSEAPLDALGRALAGDRHLRKLALEHANSEVAAPVGTARLAESLRAHPFVKAIDGLDVGPQAIEGYYNPTPTPAAESAVDHATPPPLPPLAKDMDVDPALFVKWNFAPPASREDREESKTLSPPSPPQLQPLPPPMPQHQHPQQREHPQQPGQEALGYVNPLPRGETQSGPLQHGLPPPGFSPMAGPPQGEQCDPGPGSRAVAAGAEVPTFMPQTSTAPPGFVPSGFDPSHWGNIDPHLQEEILSGFGDLWPSNAGSSFPARKF